MKKELVLIKKLLVALNQSLEQTKEVVKANIVLQKLVVHHQEQMPMLEPIKKITAEAKPKFKFTPELDYLG